MSIINPPGRAVVSSSCLWSFVKLDLEPDLFMVLYVHMSPYRLNSRKILLCKYTVNLSLLQELEISGKKKTELLASLEKLTKDNQRRAEEDDEINRNLNEQVTAKQCCGAGMFIPDPGSGFFPIPDPGSRIPKNMGR